MTEMNTPSFRPPDAESPHLSRLNSLRAKPVIEAPKLEIPTPIDTQASAKGLAALEGMKSSEASASVARRFADVREASKAAPTDLEKYLNDLN
jgi:hypothetical protein